MEEGCGAFGGGVGASIWGIGSGGKSPEQKRGTVMKVKAKARQEKRQKLARELSFSMCASHISHKDLFTPVNRGRGGRHVAQGDASCDMLVASTLSISQPAGSPYDYTAPTRPKRARLGESALDMGRLSSPIRLQGTTLATGIHTRN